jgi:hypothetical protein
MARRAEIQEDGAGRVQQGEDAPGTAGSLQVLVGDAATEQRVAGAEIVVDVQAGELAGEPAARRPA